MKLPLSLEISLKLVSVKWHNILWLESIICWVWRKVWAEQIQICLQDEAVSSNILFVWISSDSSEFDNYPQGKLPTIESLWILYWIPILYTCLQCWHIIKMGCNLTDCHLDFLYILPPIPMIAAVFLRFNRIAWMWKMLANLSLLSYRKASQEGI